MVGTIEIVTFLLYNQKITHGVEKEGTMRRTRLHTFTVRAFALAVSLSVFIITLFAVAAKNPAGTDKKTASAGYSDQILAAVYAYSKYEISLRNAVYSEDGKDDGKMLTDRIYTNAKPLNDRDKTEGWVMVESYDGATDYTATITVDMGFCAKSLVRFYLRAYRGSEFGADLPQKVSFYISDNGKKFELLGEGETTVDISQDNASAVYTFALDKAKNARYFRAVVECKGGKSLWMNEIGAAAYANVSQINCSSAGEIYDNNGFIYRITDNQAEIIGAESIEPKKTVAQPSIESFNADGVTYMLGKGSGNEVKVICDFIDEGRPNYSGVPNNIQYIVIHNTGTTEESTDAERYNKRMHNTTEETSWHYTVDDNKIYHSLADSVVGWHSGSSHNYRSIGIEICNNGAPKRSSGKFVFEGSVYDDWLENRFRKSLKNTAVLVAELLTRYGLSLDAVIQHNDVTGKNCPMWLREKDGKFVHDGTLWVEFMGYVAEYYAMLNGTLPTPSATIKRNAVIPDYITTNEGDVYPVTGIAQDAFVDMTDVINTLTIGKMIKTVEKGCLDGTLLDDIAVDKDNADFFAKDGILYTKRNEKLYDPADVKSVVPTPAKGSALDIREKDGRYYLFTNGKNTLSDIAKEYGTEQISAKTISGIAISETDIPATGAVLNFEGVRLYVIVLGDADGDGKIDQYDYILIKRTYMGTFLPQKRQYPAMTVSGEEAVCVYDYILVKRHVFGTYNISG